MRQKLLIACGLFALVGTIAVAVVLGIAGIGKAASTNTCAVDANAVPNCLTVTVLPAQLTASGQGVFIVKFKSQGSATATHPAIKIDLPDGVSIVADSVSPTPQCPSSPTGSSFTCSFANIPGFGSARIVAAFTSTAGSDTQLSGIKATLTYAEGNTNNGTPSNDTFIAFGNAISIVDGSHQAGFCTNSPTGQGSLLSTSLDGQITSIDSLTSLASGLPCTPISGGVNGKDPNLKCGSAACSSNVSFFNLPTNGTVTVLIPMSSLPNGTTDKKFILYWFSDASNVGTALKSCPTIATGTNACVQSQNVVTLSGVKYMKDVLTVQGINIDPKVAG